MTHALLYPSRARSDALVDLPDRRPPHEQAQLDQIAQRLLVSMKRAPGATRRMCRVGDAQACGRDHGLCPFLRPAEPA